jgi:GAF domain-containing protein
MSNRNPSGEDRGAPGLALRRLFSDIFTVRYRYQDELDRQRAQAVNAMALVFGSLGIVGPIFLKLLVTPTVAWTTVGANIVMGLLYLILIYWVRRGHLRRASVGFVLLSFVVPTIENVVFNLIPPGAVYLSLAVPVISSAMLLTPTWLVVTLVAALGGIGLVYVLEVRSAQIIGDVLAQGITQIRTAAIVSAFLLCVLALFSWLLSAALFRWAQSAQRRARQLEAAAVIMEVSAEAANLSSLLNTVVERISEAFGFYHAQVFMLDQEGRMARLEASTGRAGVALLSRGHALRVGSQSMVGQCSFLGEPIVVNDTALSEVWRPNELLLDTRAELTLPLKVGSYVIGVIDVQSVTPNVFQPEDIRTLQVMAQQLATTIEKTRLLDQLQVRASENQRLFEEAQTSLQQIEDLNRRLTREGWSNYLGSHAGGSVGYTLSGELMEQDMDWTAPMRQAVAGERSVVVRQDQNAHIAAVPLRVRGEVIGVLEMERGGDRPWSEEELDMAETLVDRLALAVENARLYEQATQSTEREQIINKIAQDVQAAETIDDILQAALTELSSVLGASRGIVQISPKQPERRPGQTGMLPELGA